MADMRREDIEKFIAATRDKPYQYGAGIPTAVSRLVNYGKGGVVIPNDAHVSIRSRQFDTSRWIGPPPVGEPIIRVAMTEEVAEYLSSLALADYLERNDQGGKEISEELNRSIEQAKEAYENDSKESSTEESNFLENLVSQVDYEFEQDGQRCARLKDGSLVNVEVWLATKLAERGYGSGWTDSPGEPPI